jgi:hypothetical protein
MPLGPSYDAAVTDASDDAAADLRQPSILASARAWFERRFGPPRPYVLTRWLILRLLGVVYVFAFLGLVLQGPALFGSHGLTPAATYVELRVADGWGFTDLPSLFLWGAGDGALTLWAWAGLALSLLLVAGYANLPMLLALWFIYGSFVRVGQLWFSFGWEIQILETTLLAACLAHPWDPRPLRAPAPPLVAIVLVRWLVFRIMLGAGLIKLRGDACWTELTCLDWHFETQPIPNPLSALFHALPHPVLAGGVLFNHVVEVAAPLFVFGPRKLRLVAGILMAAFQLVLIASGNLAFLNWLTLVPILACCDDDAIRRVLPRRLRGWLDRRPASRAAPRCHRILVACFAVLVVIKSRHVVHNLAFAKRQAMNRSYDTLALVNTYGAFGTVGDTRHELVIEGTLAEQPDVPDAAWRAYELPCKPGDVARRPCVLGPYHRRLDWLIWFAAMHDRPRDPWVIHLVYKLLVGDRTIRGQLAVDPFAGEPPRWVRIRRFRYTLASPGADTWWTRELVDASWLVPVSLETEGLHETLARYRWPSPSR